MNKLVYLAGPITGLSFGGAVDWRNEVIKDLDESGIVGLSPMRCKDYLSQEASIGDSYEQSILSCQKGITARDRWDCTRSDVLLVNLYGARRVSIGTVMELGWADAARIPIVLCMDTGGLHDHSMVREVAGFITNDLYSAVATVKALLV